LPELFRIRLKPARRPANHIRLKQARRQSHTRR
jgi:hypothetical protein